MLSDLNVRNFTIVEDLSLEFESGLTVLTGETGAGKSLLVGALGLVLGDRADSASVRSGCERAQISASFNVAQLPDARDWLDAQDLAGADDECHLRRVINANGRSKAFVNGHSVALAALKELGALLMDIHGQHEHQSLLRASAQRRLLDQFGKHDAVLAKLRGAFDDWYRLDQQVRSLAQANAERNERLDLLRFQVRELEDLDLTDDEFQTLADEQRRSAHVASLAEGVAAASDALSESDHAVQTRLAVARRALSPLLAFDEALGEAIAMLDEAQIQIDEADALLRRYGDDLNMDPAEHERIEKRLDQLSDVARKHRISPRELPERYALLSQRLHDLDNADTRLEELVAQREAAEQTYLQGAKTLSKKRRAAARTLAAAIGKLIARLGMPDAVFAVVVEPREGPGFGRDGMDNVRFDIAANVGEPARPIAKVASGGELSRISLAIAVVTAQSTQQRCMVFDEVDAGIGGSVATAVGQQLRRLGEDAQVLCVTHQAQVASQAHAHWQVSKAASDGKTRSAVAALDEKQRIEELARMLGGAKVTQRSREHAAEMRAQAAAR